MFNSFLLSVTGLEKADRILFDSSVNRILADSDWWFIDWDCCLIKQAKAIDWMVINNGAANWVSIKKITEEEKLLIKSNNLMIIPMDIDAIDALVFTNSNLATLAEIQRTTSSVLNKNYMQSLLLR